MELRTVNGDLNDKETQLEAARREASEGKVMLETARRESSEAVNLSGRLSEECRGLRTDFHQQVSMVSQRDELLDNCGIKPVLSRLLGGLLFSRNPFMRTRIWISTSISQVMQRWRNLSIRTIPKSLVLLWRPILILHRLSLLLMLEFQGSSLFI